MKIKIGGKKVEAEIADSLPKRIWGLSLREEGKMLFEFPRETRAKIDMALLSDSLHLYFFDSNKELIHYERARPWTWNPKTWRLYSPDRPYKYLLESFEELDLEEEDLLEIQ